MTCYVCTCLRFATVKDTRRESCLLQLPAEHVGVLFRVDEHQHLQNTHTQTDKTRQTDARTQAHKTTHGKCSGRKLGKYVLLPYAQVAGLQLWIACTQRRLCVCVCVATARFASTQERTTRRITGVLFQLTCIEVGTNNSYKNSNPIGCFLRR